jgi:hypothetical protein
MRTRVNRIELFGTTRRVTFGPGLNIVVGPISTGKTSLLELCRIAFGASVHDLPPEIAAISAIHADLTVGEIQFDVLRPLTDTRKEFVTVRLGGNTLSLTNDASSFRPEISRASSRKERYSEWLLSMFGLPKISVPKAPTKDDSEPTPVSIRDYFMYCDLPKEEIRTQVFSHKDTYKNNKRKYVFELLYGLYSAEMANEQARLRDVRAIRAQSEIHVRAVDAVLRESPWGHAAAIAKEVAAIERELQLLDEARAGVAEASMRNYGVEGLRNEIRELDEKLEVVERAIRELKADRTRKKRLLAQINVQVTKLSRAMTARMALGQLKFILCPACGKPVAEDRVDVKHCVLCTQAIDLSEPSLEELATEQSRLAHQIDETEEILEQRAVELASAEVDLAELVASREALGQRLDTVLSHYVSDRAQSIADIASREATLRERLEQKRKIFEFVSNRQSAEDQIRALLEEEDELLAAIRAFRRNTGDAEIRITMLEREMSRILLRLNPPGFIDASSVTINRKTYLPEVGGRTFASLQSEGLTVEVNIAHALAHHIVESKLGGKLPSILFVDSPSGAFGRDGYDPRRVEAIYRELRAAVEAIDFQIIVVDTSIPRSMEESVVLRLSETERLVPD